MNCFDADTYYRILEKIREIPCEVCLRIGVGGEIFTSPEILEGVRRICNEDNKIFGVNFSSNIYADWDKVISPFLDTVNTKKLGMGCTLHDQVIDDIDLFFSKVKKLQKAGVLVYVGMLQFLTGLSL